MKSSRYVIFRKQRRAALAAAVPLKILSVFGLLLMALCLAGLVGMGLSYAIFSRQFPSPDKFRLHYAEKPGPTQFYANDGETLLFTLAYEDFESRDLKICETDGDGCFPHRFTEAVRITVENGTSLSVPSALAEDMVREVYRDEIENSSRPDFLTRLLTRQILRIYGEDRILEWYYNRAWFGQMAFGLDAAARLYLDKPGDSLTDADCVLLSAVINSPMLNPIDSNGAVRDSYLEQLALLHRAGLFTDEEADSLARTNFTIFEPPRYIGGSQPDMITRKALDAVVLLYGRERVERGGMRVITTEDISLQGYISCVVSSDDFDTKAAACPLSNSYTEADLRDAAEILRTAPVSIAILDVTGGQLLAGMEGQLNNEGKRSYENAFRAYSIGSETNIFAALTAFIGGSSPSTLLWDLENLYDPAFLPAEETDEEFHGPVQLQMALANDYQRVLIQHMQAFGTGAVQRNAALFGLNSSLTLSDQEILSGGGSETAEAMAYSLTPFASLGIQSGTNVSGSMHPIVILQITFEDGSVTKPQPLSQKSLIASNLAYLVHSVFSQNSGELALEDRPAAAKTGRSSGDDSLWISGYTSQISCALHIGNPRTVSAFVLDTDRVQNTAQILWRSVMAFAHQGKPASGWETPAGISRVRICIPSGKLPTAACAQTATEIFLSGNEPYEYDEYYIEVPINRQNRMLATRFTSPEDVITEVFMNLPENAAEWAAENGIESVPTAYDPIRDEVSSGNVQIESPMVFQAFSAQENGKIEIIVRLELPQIPELHQVSIGSGMYPTQWQEVCSGSSLENGRWLLCTLDASTLTPGLYTLRTAFILPNQRYQSAETYFTVE